MTNPGSLTMRFSGVDPRQFAPSVGTAQVGNAISAAPSSAISKSTTPSTLGFFNNYIKIYIKLTEKTRNFRARHSKIDHNKSAHAQPTGQKNVCVAGTGDGDSELISTIPSVERSRIKFSKICQNFSKFQLLDLPLRPAH